MADACPNPAGRKHARSGVFPGSPTSGDAPEADAAPPRAGRHWWPLVCVLAVAPPALPGLHAASNDPDIVTHNGRTADSAAAAADIVTHNGRLAPATTDPVLDVLAGWGACGDADCRGDLDGDGVVDRRDLELALGG